MEEKRRWERGRKKREYGSGWSRIERRLKRRESRKEWS